MRTRTGAALGVAAACTLACAAGCTSGARPLAPVAPPRPIVSSHVASRVVLSPTTGRPVRHARVFAVGVDHGRAWSVRRHSVQIFDVRDLTTTRVTLPGPVSGRRINDVDIGPESVVIATAGIRNIEIYSRPLSRHGRWRATSLHVHGRLQQRQTPDVHLSDHTRTVAVLADYALGMTAAQNFLFLSHDGGSRFRQVTAPPGERTYAVSFSDRRTGFAVEGSIGVPAFLLRTDDGGCSWHDVNVPNTRSPRHRALIGRPTSASGARILIPVQHGDTSAHVTLDVSTNGGRTFRATDRSFVFAGPAHGGLPWEIGPGGGRRAVALGGRGPVATVDGHTWHNLSWFHPQRHRLRGKYAASMLGTPGDRRVFVQVSGYPDDEHGNRPQPWTFTDRSADGGRTWHVGRAHHGPLRLSAMHVLWADRRNGWAYGPELFATTDGGRTWHRQLRHYFVRTAAVAHRRLIAVGQRCADPTLPCPLRTNHIFTAAVDHEARPFTRRTLPAADVETVRATSSGAVVTVIARYRKHAPPRFDVEDTTSDKTTSHRLRLPGRCADPPFPPRLVLTGGTLWLACQMSSGSTSPEYGPALMYQSRDEGRTWIRTSGPPSTDLRALSSLTPTGARSAWAVTSGPVGGGGSRLWHTSDGGRAWRRVHGVPRGGTIDALATPTPSSAEATVRISRPRHSTVRLLHVTKDGRHTGLSPALPVPDNLPR